MTSGENALNFNNYNCGRVRLAENFLPECQLLGLKFYMRIFWRISHFCGSLNDKTVLTLQTVLNMFNWTQPHE